MQQKYIPKAFIVSLFLLLSTYSFAQQFLGLHGSSFGGVTNVNYNPAIADNPFLVDINLVALDLHVQNNYIGLKPSGLTKFSDANFQDNYMVERINGKPKTAYAGLEVQGPLSFMFSFGKKSNKNKNALAFTYHINSVTNADGVSEDLARILYLGEGTKAQAALNYLDKRFTNKNLSIQSMLWADYGVTYSRVLYDKGAHMLKAGITAKYLAGFAAVTLKSKSIDYKWHNYDTLNIYNSDVSYGHSLNAPTTGNASIGDYFKNAIDFGQSKPTFGFDLGVVYEWRPKKDKYKYEMDCKEWYRKDVSKYLLAAGFSITDMGRINFPKNVTSFNVNANRQDWYVHGFQFKGIQSLDDTLIYSHDNGNGTGQFAKSATNNTAFKMKLPMRINMYLDYHIWKGFALNVGATISPKFDGSESVVHHTTFVTVNPRFDHSWFGLYLPFSYDFDNANPSFGVTLRLGPLFIGTSDIIGPAKSAIYNMDIHVGLKVTIPYRGMPKDRDHDHVSNKMDKCPKEAGSCETMGCPDRDHDGVPDSQDKCPDDAGPKELGGCPDKDGDGIIDREDSCIDVPGLAINHGCPDRDSDGVWDKYDDCPDVPGLVEFKGCPDRDHDGVPDKDDLCPDVPGDKAHAGCPDTDGDGIYDNEDKCPREKGPIENHGCPWPDTDGDGVLDKDDKCPTVFGTKANFGCPELDKKEIETVKYAFQNLEFETGKDIIKQKSFLSLGGLAQLLVSKPNYGLKIEGHTDNVGKPEMNMELSRKRAEAVKKFLVGKGVKADNLETAGYGMTRPIADNKTAAGKQKNRRVEMTITYK